MKLTRTVGPVAVLIPILVLAGCSGDDGDGESADSKGDSTTSAGVISPADLAELPTFKKPQGIIADAKLDDCSTDPGRVEASGTVKNTAKKPRDLAIVVSWTSGAGGDVVGRGVATFASVPAGARKRWSVNTTIEAEGAVQCVLTAQAGRLN